jgi:3'-5' exoribonuclease
MTNPKPNFSLNPEDFASQPSPYLIKQNILVNTSSLPKVLRVQKIASYPEFTFSPYPVFQALLFAQGVQIAVQWIAKCEQIILTQNQLVTMLFSGIQAQSINGYLQIEGLYRLDRPDSSFNIFSTAPFDWFTNRVELHQLAQDAWELLDEKNRALLNAVLFDGDLFERFCTGPSSSAHHHSYLNGNLEHTLEVVFNVAQNIGRYKSANLQLALIFSWLHDIGKIYEYASTVKSTVQPYKLTSDAYFHGHKMNGLNLVIKTQSKYLPSYPAASFDNLRHLMEVSLNAGSSGLRTPQMLEYLLVTNADSASAAANVYASAYQPGQSWGIAPGKNLNFRYEE